MSPLKLMNFRLDEDMVDALQRVKERDGIPVTEQGRRAVLVWIREKGESVGGDTRKSERKRAGTRKRS